LIFDFFFFPESKSKILRRISNQFSNKSRFLLTFCFYSEFFCWTKRKRKKIKSKVLKKKLHTTYRSKYSQNQKKKRKKKSKNQKIYNKKIEKQFKNQQKLLLKM